MIPGWLKKIRKGDDENVEAEVRARYAQVFADIDQLRDEIQEMRESFTKGGSITWAQLAAFEISTADRPLAYPTGKHVISYRLPDIDEQMVFYSISVAPPGKLATFGKHEHPDAIETTFQLEETARCNGQDMPPFAIIVLAAGEDHNYVIPPNGRLLTLFRKAA